VSTEALGLALVSIVRPTTAAAVWAMLVGARPRRLLAVYLLAGMAVSLTVGIALVLAAGDAFSPRSGHSFRGPVLLVLGILAVLGAVAVRLGWMRRFRPDAMAVAHRTRRLSATGAATAGVLTHLPGVFYLAALGAIAGTGTAAAGEVVQVVVYNLVWFSPAIVALGICVFGRIPSGDRLAGAVSWGRAHQDTILAVCFGVVGVWLIAKGVSDLG
jgi:hypothetical protein